MAALQESILHDDGHDPEFDEVGSVEKGYFTARAKPGRRGPTLQQVDDEHGPISWRYLTDGDLVP